MAVKTFAVGELVTASDANTYLANSGLVFVKSQTVGSGVSSVTVSSAFSAEYDAYRVVWTGGNGSAAGELSLRLGSSTANYYGFIMYGSYTGATLYGLNDSAQSSFRYVGGLDGFFGSLVFDIVNPFLARVTTINAQGNYGAFSFGTYSGRHAETTSYSAFTITPNAGTLSGGVITVYGYRKA